MFEALRKLLTDWFGPPTQSQAHSPEPENTEISRLIMKTDEIHAEISEPIAVPPVPYDETLLERTRAQWRQGEWESLAQLNRDTLQHHPDRAKLALLAAAGRLQTGNNTEEARQLIRLAQDWGIGKKLISQILIAGVHNSIGRGAALGNHQQRALQHFENAITIGTPGSAKELISNARAKHEFEVLGLLPGCHGLLQKYQAKEESRKLDNQEVIAEKINSIRVDESKVAAQCARLPPEDFINASFDVQDATPTRDVLVIFSTPRSGSTLLCDVLRKNGMCLAHEYFQPFEYLPLLAQRWGCIDNGELIPDRFVERLCRYRTFANGWLGINLHGSHIPVFQRFIEFFPDVRFHYMHLYRRDLVAQAISLNLAVQTGMWSSHFRPSDEQRVPEYDFAAIEAARREIEQQNLLVRAFLAGRRLECRDVVYEDLVAGSSALGEYLATLFGKTGAVEFRTDLRKQGANLNDVWREMYCRQVVDQKRDTRIGLVDFA